LSVRDEYVEEYTISWRFVPQADGSATNVLGYRSFKNETLQEFHPIKYLKETQEPTLEETGRRKQSDLAKVREASGNNDNPDTPVLERHQFEAFVDVAISNRIVDMFKLGVTGLLIAFSNETFPAERHGRPLRIREGEGKSGHRRSVPPHQRQRHKFRQRR
jgi:hypothetical protein